MHNIMHVCVRACVHACVCVRVRVCVCVCVCVHTEHTSTKYYIHTNSQTHIRACNRYIQTNVHTYV